MAFRDQLLGNVLHESQKSQHAGRMLDSLVKDELKVFRKEKERIKSNMVAK